MGSNAETSRAVWDGVMAKTTKARYTLKADGMSIDVSCTGLPERTVVGEWVVPPFMFSRENKTHKHAGNLAHG